MSATASTELGHRLAAARRRAGMSQRDLADRIGIQHSQISEYEAQGRQPRPGRLQQIAEALGLEIEELDPNADASPSAAGGQGIVERELASINAKLDRLLVALVDDRSRFDEVLDRLGAAAEDGIRDAQRAPRRSE